MKVANETMLRVEGEVRQSRGMQASNEEVVSGSVGNNPVPRTPPMASPVSEQTPTTRKFRKTYTDLVAILPKDLNHDQLRTLSKRVKKANVERLHFQQGRETETAGLRN